MAMMPPTIVVAPVPTLVVAATAVMAPPVFRSCNAARAKVKVNTTFLVGECYGRLSTPYLCT
jgi:hypothetical protein